MDTLEVAFVGRLKHAAIYRAAKKHGSQAALARVLGIDQSAMSDWVLMRRYPQFSDELDTLLVKHVGKGWYELWPSELRQKIDEGAKPRRGDIAVFREIECGKILGYRGAVLLPGPVEEAESVEIAGQIHRALRKLSYREREVIKARYGLDGGEPLTLEECSHVFKVTRERVRQIESTALRRFRCNGESADDLRKLLRQPSHDTAVDQTPVPGSLKHRVQVKNDERDMRLAIIQREGFRE